jgi:hypothetical protein
MLVSEDVHQIRSGYHGIYTGAIRLGTDYRGPPRRGHGKVRQHLAKLTEKGRIVGRASEDGVWWSWKGEPGR